MLVGGVVEFLQILAHRSMQTSQACSTHLENKTNLESNQAHDIRIKIKTLKMKTKSSS